MREAEANLDNFWSKVDKSVASKGRAIGDILGKYLKAQDLQRTAPWVEPQKQSKTNAAKSLEEDDIE